MPCFCSHLLLLFNESDSNVPLSNFLHRLHFVSRDSAAAIASRRFSANDIAICFCSLVSKVSSSLPASSDTSSDDSNVIFALLFVDCTPSEFSDDYSPPQDTSFLQMVKDESGLNCAVVLAFVVLASSSIAKELEIAKPRAVERASVAIRVV